jgi:hypothetical protein
VKAYIDAALRAAQPFQEQIGKIKEIIKRDDPRFEIIDDVELGAKWVIRRLKDLEDAMPPAQ